MATATEVKLCPHCEDALPNPRPSSCPHCGRSLTTEIPKARFFECPDYLWFQKEELTRLPDKKPKEGDPMARSKVLLEIHEDMTAFVRACPQETLNAALFDAHLILSHVLHAKIDGPSLKKIVSAAKAIGKLGETIDQYIRAGGSVSDDNRTGETGQLFSAAGGDSRGATATADSGGGR